MTAPYTIQFRDEFRQSRRDVMTTIQTMSIDTLDDLLRLRDITTTRRTQTIPSYIATEGAAARLVYPTISAGWFAHTDITPLPTTLRAPYPAPRGDDLAIVCPDGTAINYTRAALGQFLLRHEFNTRSVLIGTNTHLQLQDLWDAYVSFGNVFWVDRDRLRMASARLLPPNHIIPTRAVVNEILEVFNRVSSRYLACLELLHRDGDIVSIQDLTQFVRGGGNPVHHQDHVDTGFYVLRAICRMYHIKDVRALWHLRNIVEAGNCVGQPLRVHPSLVAGVRTIFAGDFMSDLTRALPPLTINIDESTFVIEGHQPTTRYAIMAQLNRNVPIILGYPRQTILRAFVTLGYRFVDLDGMLIIVRSIAQDTPAAPNARAAFATLDGPGPAALVRPPQYRFADRTRARLDHIDRLDPYTPAAPINRRPYGSDVFDIPPAPAPRDPYVPVRPDSVTRNRSYLDDTNPYDIPSRGRLSDTRARARSVVPNPPPVHDPATHGRSYLDDTNPYDIPRRVRPSDADTRARARFVVPNPPRARAPPIYDPPARNSSYLDDSNPFAIPNRIRPSDADAFRHTRPVVPNPPRAQSPLAARNRAYLDDFFDRYDHDHPEDGDRPPANRNNEPRHRALIDDGPFARPGPARDADAFRHTRPVVPNPPRAQSPLAARNRAYLDDFFDRYDHDHPEDRDRPPADRNNEPRHRALIDDGPFARPGPARDAGVARRAIPARRNVDNDTIDFSQLTSVIAPSSQTTPAERAIRALIAAIVADAVRLPIEQAIKAIEATPVADAAHLTTFALDATVHSVAEIPIFQLLATRSPAAAQLIRAWCQENPAESIIEVLFLSRLVALLAARNIECKLETPRAARYQIRHAYAIIASRTTNRPFDNAVPKFQRPFTLTTKECFNAVEQETCPIKDLSVDPDQVYFYITPASVECQSKTTLARRVDASLNDPTDYVATGQLTINVHHLIEAIISPRQIFYTHQVAPNETDLAY